MSGGRVFKDLIQVLLEPFQDARQLLALFLCNAGAKLGAQFGVEATNFFTHRPTGVRYRHLPHATVSRVGVAVNQLTRLQVVNAGSGCRTTQSEAIRNLGLGVGSEFGEEGYERCLGEIEIKGGEPPIESLPDATSGTDQPGFNPGPGEPVAAHHLRQVFPHSICIGAPRFPRGQP